MTFDTTSESFDTLLAVASVLPSILDDLWVEEIPITDHVRLPLGELKLGIRGRPNKRVWIEASSDLANWHPITTTLADRSGQAFFTDKSNFKGNRRPSTQDHAHPVTSDHDQGHGQEDDYYPTLFFRSVVPEKWR